MSWPWQHWLTFIPGGSNRYESARSAETQLNPWVRKITWRREQPPTPVFLPGEFHGQRGLVGYSPWGRKEVDTTEQLTVSLTSRLSRGFPGGSVAKKKICLPMQETQETRDRPWKEEKWQPPYSLESVNRHSDYYALSVSSKSHMGFYSLPLDFYKNTLTCTEQMLLSPSCKLKTWGPEIVKDFTSAIL